MCFHSINHYIIINLNKSLKNLPKQNRSNVMPHFCLTQNVYWWNLKNFLLTKVSLKSEGFGRLERRLISQGVASSLHWHKSICTGATRDQAVCQPLAKAVSKVTDSVDKLLCRWPALLPKRVSIWWYAAAAESSAAAGFYGINSCWTKAASAVKWWAQVDHAHLKTNA